MLQPFLVDFCDIADQSLLEDGFEVGEGGDVGERGFGEVEEAAELASE